jgi:hypothetical protein
MDEREPIPLVDGQLTLADIIEQEGIEAALEQLQDPNGEARTVTVNFTSLADLEEFARRVKQPIDPHTTKAIWWPSRSWEELAGKRSDVPLDRARRLAGDQAALYGKQNRGKRK